MKALLYALAAAAGLAVVGVVWFMGTRADMIQMHDISLESFGRIVEASRERGPLSDALTDAARKGGVAESAIQPMLEARAKAESVKVDERLIDDAENFKRYDHYQAAWAAAQLSLLAAADASGLKADKGYRKLKEDVESLESRIETERRDYNALALQFNDSRQGFPGANIARRDRLDARPYLAETAPAAEKK